MIPNLPYEDEMTLDTATDSKTKVTRSVANVLKANGSPIPEKGYTRRSN